MVAPEFGDLALSRFKSDAGIGVRFHGPLSHAVAHRAGEGPRRAAPGLLRKCGVLTMLRLTMGPIVPRDGDRPGRRAVAVLLAGAAPQGAAPRFFHDDPLTREPETQDASKVEPWDIDLAIDLATNLFSRPGDKTPDVRAQNVNTIDEVPDSSWFTNRIGARPLSIEDAVRGPLRSNGPVPEGWTVTRAKEAGASPGFTMKDAAGETWFVSFDPRGFPEAVTGGVLVANKIFWALGYYQVENHLITVRPDRLSISDKATFRPPSGVRRPLRRGDLDAVFEQGASQRRRHLPCRRRPGRPRQGARRLPLSRHAARRSERRRAARAPARAARAQGVRRVDQPRRHEGRQHARHPDPGRTAAASSATTCRTSARRSARARSAPAIPTRATTTCIRAGRC